VTIISFALILFNAITELSSSAGAMRVAPDLLGRAERNKLGSPILRNPLPPLGGEGRVRGAAGDGG